MNSSLRAIHILLRGDALLVDDHDDQYASEFRRRGLLARTVPPLSFKFTNLHSLVHLLEDYYCESNQDDKAIGLIITSPRVVHVINEAVGKDERKRSMIKSMFTTDFVFTIGKKSAQDCKMILGIEPNSGSSLTGNSRNLVEFIEKVGTHYSSVRLLYPKGSRSDDYIEKNLYGGTFQVQSIIVYETHPRDDIDSLCLEKLEEIKKSTECDINYINLIFFSPSGLESYLRHNRDLFLEKIKALFRNNNLDLRYSSIGEKTKRAIELNDLRVFATSVEPNPSSLVESIIKSLSEIDTNE